MSATTWNMMVNLGRNGRQDWYNFELVHTTHLGIRKLWKITRLDGNGLPVKEYRLTVWQNRAECSCPGGTEHDNCKHMIFLADIGALSATDTATQMLHRQISDLKEENLKLHQELQPWWQNQDKELTGKH